MMLNTSGKTGHLCFGTDYVGGKIQFFTIKHDMSYRFFVEALYQVDEVPFYSWFPEGFYLEWMLNFVKSLFCINLYDHESSS